MRNLTDSKDHKVSISDAAYHLAHAQYSLNLALMHAPNPSAHHSYKRMVDHNAKLLRICRRLRDAR